ncbi:MAG: ABC transporter ATP-binding protein, partial [Candidatus Heimdallarchaeaceae archaeon]
MVSQLEIHEISKIYDKQIRALSNINLTLNQGIIGLVGPNGAGKSTLMRILATIIKPTEGKVLWNGVDVQKKPNEIRKILGYLPQSFGVYPKLTSIEFLEYIAALKGINRKLAKERIQEILRIVNLHHLQKTSLSKYSGGMKQRIGIAQALLNDPKLLIIDEPTAGLDPEERVRFRQLMADLAKDRIIILSTHIVSDVEACANTIALISRGKLLQKT